MTERCIVLPYVQHEIGTGEHIEERGLVEFRLLYQGEIFAASRNSTRSAHKHAIRRIFHPQLRRLWNTESNLYRLAEHRYMRTLPRDGTIPGHTKQEIFQIGINNIGDNWQRNGFRFVPLVTADLVLRCSLDILLLRPEGQRFILTKGDIDGQLKTLFDALRIPSSGEDTGGSDPQNDENPFFCLLEDDRLITEVRVVADNLLLLPNQNERECKATDSFVVIHARLNHRNPWGLTNYFG